MADWSEGRLRMSGAELEVQEALRALRRLLQTGAIRSTTRVVVEGAILALEGDDPDARAERPARQPFGGRRAAPK